MRHGCFGPRRTKNPSCYLKSLPRKTGEELRNGDRLNRAYASSRIDELKEKECSVRCELGEFSN